MIVTDFPEETVLLVAKAINGPHSSDHIGEEKLRELQDHRWNAQTTKIDKAECMNSARAALAVIVNDTNMLQSCFVAVCGDEVLMNTVGSNKAEVEANLGMIELSDDEMEAVEVLPTKMLKPVKSPANTLDPESSLNP